MQSVEIHGKQYFKIHELTRQISLELDYNPLPVNSIKDLLLGINSLAVELENEFIYRGDLIREMLDVFEKHKSYNPSIN